jgi:predicted aspartyl protease
MPINNYPFKTNEKIFLPSPILPIRIINPHNGFDYLTWGLIDTGAANSAIPEHIAKTLGHDIRSVKPIPGFGASGNFDT